MANLALSPRSGRYTKGKRGRKRIGGMLVWRPVMIHNEDRERGNAPVLTKTEARQGITPHVTRYVLGWGLVLVIVAFCLIYLFHP